MILMATEGQVAIFLQSRGAGRTTVLLAHLIVESKKEIRFFLVPTMRRKRQVLELAKPLVERSLEGGEKAMFYPAIATIEVVRGTKILWSLRIVASCEMAQTNFGRDESQWDLIADHL